MAKEAVVQLFRAAQVDLSLKNKLNTAPDLASFIDMAKTYGYEFTAQEWRDMTSFSVEEFKGKLSEIPGI
ncbi:MAG: Nif11-like leader peptide family natural product precursor [Cyanobacteria bacterium P01_A01_bin.114]